MSCRPGDGDNSILMIPGVNSDPPVAEDDSKTTSPNESMQGNVIEPNGSDPDGAV